MMVCGMLFRPLPLEPVIGANDWESFSPTPTTSTGGREPEGTTGRKLITKISDHYIPTLTSHPDKRSPEAIENYEAQGKKASRTTIRAVRENWMLPTPCSNDGQKMGSAYLQENRQQTTFGDNLPRAIGKHFLPTPTTRDHKDTPGMAFETPDGRDRTDQLPRAIFSQTSETASPVPLGGMRLSLEFQCWFQGYPQNWLKPLLSASEIQSSHKRGSQSPKPSPPN